MKEVSRWDDPANKFPSQDRYFLLLPTHWAIRVHILSQINATNGKLHHIFTSKKKL